MSKKKRKLENKKHSKENIVRIQEEQMKDISSVNNISKDRKKKMLKNRNLKKKPSRQNISQKRGAKEEGNKGRNKEKENKREVLRIRRQGT